MVFAVGESNSVSTKVSVYYVIAHPLDGCAAGLDLVNARLTIYFAINIART